MKAKLEVTLTTLYPVHCDIVPEHPDFFYQGHLCLDDVLDNIMREVAQVPNGCTCYRGKIKFLEYVE